MKAHYMGRESLYIIFLGGTLLNFNNVIIKNDFHNFLNIMIARYMKKSLDFILFDQSYNIFFQN